MLPGGAIALAVLVMLGLAEQVGPLTNGTYRAPGWVVALEDTVPTHRYKDLIPIQKEAESVWRVGGNEAVRKWVHERLEL